MIATVGNRHRFRLLSADSVEKRLEDHLLTAMLG
jgi:hypothetical protein